MTLFGLANPMVWFIVHDEVHIPRQSPITHALNHHGIIASVRAFSPASRSCRIVPCSSKLHLYQLEVKIKYYFLWFLLEFLTFFKIYNHFKSQHDLRNKYESEASPVQGCKMRDHIVSVPSEENCDEATSAQIRVLNDLLLHRDAVCLSNSSPVDRWASVQTFCRFFISFPDKVEKHICELFNINDDETLWKTCVCKQRGQPLRIREGPGLWLSAGADAPGTSEGRRQLRERLCSQSFLHFFLNLNSSISPLLPVFPFEKLESPAGRTSPFF